MSNMSNTDVLADVKNLIRPVEDFPKPGILFRDIMPIFQNPNAVRNITDVMTAYIEEHFSNVDVIAGLEARGFLIGPQIAMNLNKPFVPVRKQGKLPGSCLAVDSTKEYGKDVLEIQCDALRSDQNVVIVDDLMATGGTLEATCRLISSAKANVVGCLCIVELTDLNGKSKLNKPFHAFIQY